MIDQKPTPRIADRAPAVTHQERILDATPAQVFDLVADVAAWPDWQPEVSTASVAGPVQLGSTFHWKSGVSITSRIVAFEPGRAIAWTGRALGTRAIHTWTFEAVEGGTLVRTEESMTGWLPRLLTRMVRRRLEQGVAGVLDALESAVAR